MTCPCKCECEQGYTCSKTACSDDEAHEADFCHCETRGCNCTDFEYSMMIAGAERALVREGRLQPASDEEGTNMSESKRIKELAVAYSYLEDEESDDVKFLCCEECGNEQADMGRNVACEQCGARMPEPISDDEYGDVT